MAVAIGNTVALLNKFLRAFDHCTTKCCYTLEGIEEEVVEEEGEEEEEEEEEENERRLKLLNVFPSSSSPVISQYRAACQHWLP